VSEVVVRGVNNGKNSQQISEELVHAAIYEKYTEDNVTVITVLFNWDQNGSLQTETST